MLKIEKKQVKIISVAIAAVFMLSVVGIAVSQTGTTQAAAASNVGKVNFEDLVRAHPDFAKFAETMKAEQETAQKEFDAKAPSMANDQERQEFLMQLQQRLQMKEAELLNPIREKVMATIKEVADTRGLSVVMPAGMVIYGGQDITDDVKKKLGGK
ncbi:OmpH family outer membrane protein [Anaeroselena agilis]|uniref:OmpH family outer membrane protein n=1 Tax=Anaeroselena agilis TaxID=3063788 RepID=A0ABU3P439_9FIRM|nr:OmpH family outer membrane protein [Selenomonadales bacterium 4137-cl]